MGWGRRVGATALLALVVTAFVLLGRWQWTTARAPEPTPITGTRSLVEVVALEQYVPLEAIGSRVVAEGRLEPDTALRVPSRSAAGASTDPGSCWEVTPLVLDDGSAVAVVTGALTCDSPAATVPGGQTRVEGVLQPSDPATDTLDVAPPLLGSVTTDLLVRRWPWQLRDGYVVVDGIQPLRPVPPAVGIDLRNAAYALQWWFFAGFAVVVWWRAVRVPRPDEDEEAQAGTVAASAPPADAAGAADAGGR